MPPVTARSAGPVKAQGRAGRRGPAAGMAPFTPKAWCSTRKVTRFITVTTDSGKIKSIDAGAGTIEVTEEANSVTYKTVTLTIPSGATVTLDGKSSSLEGLAAGDHVIVSSSSEGTNVFAADSSFHPAGTGPRRTPSGGRDARRLVAVPKRRRRRSPAAGGAGNRPRRSPADTRVDGAGPPQPAAALLCRRVSGPWRSYPSCGWRSHPLSATHPLPAVRGAR